MIKQVYELSGLKLSDNYYGKKIRSYIDAYGFKYDFCRVYRAEKATILVYNSLMVIDGLADDEIIGFINMLNPVTIELLSNNTLQLCFDYECIHRTLFEVLPNENNIISESVKQNTLLDKIFPILSDGFGISEYDVWYADISHRIRHNVSDIYLYNYTTVTKSFDIDGFVFLSHIATDVNARGKGTAGNLLHYLAGVYAENNKRTFLFARDHRKSFYESIGCAAIGEDYLYETERGF